MDTLFKRRSCRLCLLSVDNNFTTNHLTMPNVACIQERSEISELQCSKGQNPLHQFPRNK